MWFWPLVCIASGIAVSVASVSIDRAFDGALVPRWLTGGPDAALEILGTVAGSMVSLTALVLTVVLVVIQLGMGQFSPRIVAEILQDKPSQLPMASPHVPSRQLPGRSRSEGAVKEACSSQAVRTRRSGRFPSPSRKRRCQNGREMFENWSKMIALVQSGLDVSPLITHRLGIHDFEESFAAMRSGSSGEVVLERP